jgi:hypothetical protein
MSRQHTGKTSIFALWLRWEIIWFIVMSPFIWFFEPARSSIVWGTLWVTNILWILLVIFMRIWGSIVQRGSTSYQQWLLAGGSPFWDTLAWPFNTDPPQVRAAIGQPPQTSNCQFCGTSLRGLFGYGGNYGNQCNQCGNFNDTFTE